MQFAVTKTIKSVYFCGSLLQKTGNQQ